MKTLLLALIIVSSPVLACQGLEVSGFGNIGLTYNDSEYYGYRRDSSHNNDVFEDEIDLRAISTLGLQLEYNLISSFDAVYQAVYRDQPDFNFDSATQLAFLRYKPNSNWTFRLGRTPFDIFLLSDYRDVSFAYPWATIPAETYGSVPYRGVDGGDVTYTQQLEPFTLSTKLFTGKNDVAFFGSALSSGSSIEFDRVLGVSVDLQSLNWVAKLKYTQVRISTEIASEAIDGINLFNSFVPGFEMIWPDVGSFIEQLRTENENATYISASGRYDFDKLSLISEISQVDSPSLSVPTINSAY